MKTAMQELIQSLKAEQMIASNEWQMGYQKALSNVILEIESMLEKEKEQMIEFARNIIIDAVCSVEGYVTTEKDIEEYYNEIYNKQ
jgi:hypothetical protein